MTSLRAGARLGFMHERDARRAAKPRERGGRWAGPAHLAHTLAASPLASRISHLKPKREPARRLRYDVMDICLAKNELGLSKNRFDWTT